MPVEHVSLSCLASAKLKAAFVPYYDRTVTGDTDECPLQVGNVNELSWSFRNEN